MALSEKEKRRIEEEERQRAQIVATAEILQANQKYGVPALLSFFIPGLGQMIKGQVGKGILILLGWIFSFVLIVTGIGIIVPIIIWVWQIADAYNSKSS